MSGKIIKFIPRERSWRELIKSDTNVINRFIETDEYFYTMMCDADYIAAFVGSTLHKETMEKHCKEGASIREYLESDEFASAFEEWSATDQGEQALLTWRRSEGFTKALTDWFERSMDIRMELEHAFIQACDDNNIDV